MKLFRKIKHWYWWKFKATEEEKCQYDMMMFGTRIMKGGKRIDPRVLIAEQAIKDVFTKETSNEFYTNKW